MESGSECNIRSIYINTEGATQFTQWLNKWEESTKFQADDVAEIGINLIKNKQVNLEAKLELADKLLVVLNQYHRKDGPRGRKRAIQKVVQAVSAIVGHKKADQVDQAFETRLAQIVRDKFYDADTPFKTYTTTKSSKGLRTLKFWESLPKMWRASQMKRSLAAIRKHAFPGHLSANREQAEAYLNKNQKERQVFFRDNASESTYSRLVRIPGNKIVSFTIPKEATFRLLSLDNFENSREVLKKAGVKVFLDGQNVILAPGQWAIETGSVSDHILLKTEEGVDLKEPMLAGKWTLEDVAAHLKHIKTDYYETKKKKIHEKWKEEIEQTMAGKVVVVDKLDQAKDPSCLYVVPEHTLPKNEQKGFQAKGQPSDLFESYFAYLRPPSFGESKHPFHKVQDRDINIKKLLNNVKEKPQARDAVLQILQLRALKNAGLIVTSFKVKESLQGEYFLIPSTVEEGILDMYILKEGEWESIALDYRKRPIAAQIQQVCESKPLKDVDAFEEPLNEVKVAIGGDRISDILITGIKMDAQENVTFKEPV